MADEGGSYYSLSLLPHRFRFVGYLLLLLNVGSAYLFYPANKGAGRFYSGLLSFHSYIAFAYNHLQEYFKMRPQGIRKQELT
jgi:hypothetical protein